MLPNRIFTNLNTFFFLFITLTLVFLSFKISKIHVTVGIYFYNLLSHPQITNHSNIAPYISIY